MMKKLFWLVLSTVILTGQSIFAQEADSEVQSSQREDSLLQVVNELSDRVQKTEDAARNERIWKKRAKYWLSGNIWLVSFKISYLCLPLFYETRTTPSCHPSGCAYRQL